MGEFSDWKCVFFASDWVPYWQVAGSCPGNLF